MHRKYLHRNRIHQITAAAAALFLCGTLASCAPPTASGGADGGDGVILGRAMDLTTLDLSRTFCDSCQIYNAAVYDTLLSAPSADGELEPLLAESWEANDDHTQFTFTLQPDAVFADGSPVEAKDVKWSWERLQGLEGSPSFLMAGVESIDTPDEKTVVVNSEHPNSAFFNIVSAGYTGIINSDLAAENGATTDPATDTAEEWFMENSAGSGQYVLESYAEGDQLVLSRNDSYWGETPNFSSVTIKDVADSSSQLQQLQQGDIDVAMQLSFDALSQVEGDSAITSEVVPSYNFVYVALSPGAAGADPVLAEPEVREAIRAGIDYEAVIDATVGGHGELQSTALPNGFEGSADLPLPKYDPEAAKELLAEAGHADGLDLDVTFPTFTIYGVNFGTMFQSIQQSLSGVGIDLNLNPLEYSAWAEQIGSEGIPVTSVYYAPDHPDSIQYPQYFSRAADTTWGKRSGLPEDPEQTELQAQALAQTGEDRTATFAELGQKMYDDALILPIVNPNIILASGTNVEGNNYHVTRNIDLRELKFTE
ncbi:MULTISPECIES: ABC transporter substrate-binding protein [Brevibacterium]|uniref:ABC transporter substrate-binding protein n=1 Tax=Brevibacterium salitolerans TaxID=1403566 RepID=A0ABN2WRB0_9MICO|nr:ABC transporter substrate-binding protein [Brevibacterium sp.]